MLLKLQHAIYLNFIGALNVVYRQVLTHFRERIVFGSNLRTKDFDGFTRYEGPCHNKHHILFQTNLIALKVKILIS